MSNRAAVTVPTWHRAWLLFQHGIGLGYYSNMASGLVTIPTWTWQWAWLLFQHGHGNGLGYYSNIGQYKTWTADYGLRTGYKTRTQVYDSTMIECFERSTVERPLRRIRTCHAVYLYNTHIIRLWQNEEQKVDK